MSKFLTIAIGIGIVIAAVGTFVADDIIRIVQEFRQPPEDECGPRPLDAQIVSDEEFEVALKNSIAVFKGQSTSQLLDAFPSEARNAQMAAFMACKAFQQGLITNNDEHIEFLKTMQGFFDTGRFPERMRHEGSLLNLREFLDKDPGQSWTLTIPRELENFYVTNKVASNPTELMQKICNSNPCLVCSGVNTIREGGVVSISLRPDHALADHQDAGDNYKSCEAS